MSDKQDCRENGVGQQYSDSNSSGQPRAEPWKDPDKLRELYHVQELSQRQIAQHFDIKQQTISYWMEKLGIETRPPMDERTKQSVRRNRLGDGKILYAVSDVDEDGEDTTTYLYEHQLVALLPFDPYVVFDENTHIHHIIASPIPVDLPENLDVLGAREHLQLHAGGAWEPKIEDTLNEIRDGDVDKSVSMDDDWASGWDTRLHGD